MKILSAAFLTVLLFAVGGFSQVKKEGSNAALKAATLKITLLDLPGVNLEKSKWELAYELRIASEKELFDAMTNGRLNLDADKKLGELVAKSSFTKNALSKKENREAFLTVPLDAKIQEKLATELELLNKSAAAPNKNTPEALRERQLKTQNFLMYANILVYDAKLKKNIVVPFHWVLPFARFAHFPGANFQMTFQIKENGEYARSMVLPEKTKNSKTITVKQ
jgi:hypothetical protein